MEDSAFSTDFTNSFLNWDDDDAAVAAPAPVDCQNTKLAGSETAGAESTTQQSMMAQHQSQQNVQEYTQVPQYQVMMGNAVGQKIVMAPGSSFVPSSNIVNVMPPSFPGMIAQSLTHGSAGGNADIQQATRPLGSVSSNVASHRPSTTQLHPLGIQSSANCPPHAPNSSFIPLLYNPFLQPGSVMPNQQFWTMIQASQQQQHLQQSQQQQLQHAQRHLPKSQQQHLQQQNQQQKLPLVQQQTQQQVQEEPQKLRQSQENLVQEQPQAPAPSAVAENIQVPTSSATTITTQTNGKPMPPFYLFDAPCELRANFLQSQRMHNLPVSEDNNSFHYGMVVNGFHPQRNAQINPGDVHSFFPPLIDGRSKKSRKAGKERNEREQKRAQKITDLIETLRSSMEKGGWKVELKSKYHTLSTCADYLKHLSKITKEKEELVNQAKTELEMTERKLEEEKANFDRSDPESVASSLTCGSKKNDKKEDDRKRHSDADNRGKLKKSKVNDAFSDTSSSNASDESGRPDMKNISLDKMSSRISDITDSNKESSRGSDGNNEKSLDSSGGVVSNVASCGSNREQVDHADVVVKVRKQQRAPGASNTKNPELTSMDAEFELDYEEVFVSSNIPQLIATPAGRIVACNDFFVKALGLSKDEVSRLTIFSLVQPDKLSNLFEMVAEALRGDRHRHEQNGDISAGEGSDSSGRTTNESKSGESRRCEYAVMTLPCISFPSRTKPGSTHHPNPMYMTISLMTDEDPKKRCFHCMMTDNPGTDGSKGFITPELLALMFAPDTKKVDEARDVVSPRCNFESSLNAEMLKAHNMNDDNMQESCMLHDDEDEDDVELAD